MPTPETLPVIIADLFQKGNAGKSAYENLLVLIGRIQRRIDRSDPLSLPLTQEEVTHIVNTQLPLYNAILGQIERAGDALGTDPFN